MNLGSDLRLLSSSQTYRGRDLYYSAASLTESRPEHMVFLQAGLCERE